MNGAPVLCPQVNKEIQGPLLLEKIMRLMKHLALVAMVGILCMQTAYGADVTWTGTNGTSWDDGLNWVGDAVPAGGDNVIFIEDGSTSTSAVLQSSVIVGDMTFSSTAAPGGFTVSSSLSTYTLSLGGTVTVANSFPGAAITADVLVNGANVTNVFDIGNGSTLTLGAFNGIVANTPSNTLAKTGSGSLVINGLTKSKYVNVSDGSLTINGTGLITTGLAVDPSATFTIASSAAMTLTLPAISGTVTVNDTATVTTTGNYALNGAVVLNDNAIWNSTGGSPTYGASASYTFNGSSTAVLRGNNVTGMPGPISVSGWSDVTVNTGTWKGDITVSGTSVITQKISSGPFFYGDIAISDDARAYLFFSGTSIPANQTITVSGNGLATMGSNGKTWGNFVLSDNARVVFTGNEKPGGMSLTDNAILDMGYGTVGTDVKFYGDVSADMQTSGTLRGDVYGNLSLSDYASFDVGGAMKVRGGTITLSGSSHISHEAGLVNYQVYDAGDMTVEDDATVTSNNVSTWQFWNAASTLTVQDRANLYLNIGRADAAIVTQGSATAVLWQSNGCNQTNSITSNGSSSLTMYGGPVSGSVVVNDTSSMDIGRVSGPITMAAGASLNLNGGNCTTYISDLIDTRTVTLGGGYIHSGLTLSNTLDVSGSKTLTLRDWVDPEDIPWANVYLTDLTGSGTITRSGGPNVILWLGDATGATWTGNIVNQTGGLAMNDNTVPAGLGEIELSTAGASLLLSNTTTPGDIVTLTAKTIKGVGKVVLGVVDTDPGTGNKLSMVGGTLSPGNGIGDLSVMGDLEFAMNGATAAQLLIEAAGGPSYDRLLVSGTLTGLDKADLVLDIARSGWASYVSATLTIVTAVNDLSAIAPLNSVTWNNNMVGQVNYTSGAITLTHVGLAGDGNNDGAIDATDYADWFNNYGTTPGAWATGDFNGDGSVDATDYADWFNNYGAGTSGGPVPEPATMTLLVLGGLAMLRRRK